MNLDIYAFDVLLPIKVKEIKDNDEEKDSIDLPNFPLDINKLENLKQLELNGPFCKKKHYKTVN